MLRTLRLVLTGAMIALFAVPGWSAPSGQNRDQVSRIWVFNVGRETVEVKIDRSRSGISSPEALFVSPGELVEVRRGVDEEIGLPGHRDLLVVTTPAAFDPTDALKVDTIVDRAGRRDGPRARAEGASIESAAKPVVLEQGEMASSILTGTEPEPRTLRLRLQEQKSWAEVRFKGLDGAVLGYITLSASRPLDVTLDFGRLLQKQRHWGSVRREVIAHAGKVSVFTKSAAEKNPGPIRQVIAALSNGTGYFNHTRNWELTPPLRYYVEGGPANTCGELNANRNGTWYFTPGWLCTNGSGYAEMGPWYWSSQTDDETAEAFIRWPDSTATSSDWHYWDTRCPIVGIYTVHNPPFGLYAPPEDWRGNADDPQFGACFGAWTRVYATFQETNPSTGAVRYWTNGSSDYLATSPSEIDGSLSGLPTCGAEWTTPFPPAGAHTSGFRYQWTICLEESPGHSNCEPCTSYEFTY